MIELCNSYNNVLLIVLSAATIGCQNHENGNGVAGQKDASVAQGAPERATTAQEPAEPRLRRLVPLNDVARELLKEPMQRHASTMRKLTWASIMLDYPSVQATAVEVLAEPRISRPVSMDEGVFEISLSSGYLARETQLYDAARSLRDAAASKDPLAMSTAYLEMAGTCLGCHATYLEMPGNP